MHAIEWLLGSGRVGMECLVSNNSGYGSNSRFQSDSRDGAK
jgi:hypothetical protein